MNNKQLLLLEMTVINLLSYDKFRSINDIILGLPEWIIDKLPTLSLEQLENTLTQMTKSGSLMASEDQYGPKWKLMKGITKVSTSHPPLEQ